MKLRPKYIAANNTLIVGSIPVVVTPHIFTYNNTLSGVTQITLASHPFSRAGLIATHDGTGWQLATSAVLNHIGIVVVTSVIDANHFTIASIGRVNIDDATFAGLLAIGSYYYVTGDGTGNVVSTDTNLLVSNPIFQVINIAGPIVTIDILNYRPNAKINPPMFQGIKYGYLAGGYSTSAFKVIDKFKFDINLQSTTVGNLTLATHSASGHQSETDGYITGGITTTVPLSNIEMVSFAVDDNSYHINDMTVLLRRGAASSSSLTYGYIAGGGTTTSWSSNVNTIEKMQFTVTTPVTIVGTILLLRSYCTGYSSLDSGYTSGGILASAPWYTNQTDRFSFSIDSNATAVGYLSVIKYGSAGGSSPTYGYCMGGNNGGILTDVDKFSFTVNNNATNIGALTIAKYYTNGVSSTTEGYNMGGMTSIAVADISGISFVSDIITTGITTLSISRFAGAGFQV